MNHGVVNHVGGYLAEVDGTPTLYTIGWLPGIEEKEESKGGQVAMLSVPATVSCEH